MDYIGYVVTSSYQINPSRRTQSSGWLGLTGSAAPREVFGMVPSIRTDFCINQNGAGKNGYKVRRTAELIDCGK